MTVRRLAREAGDGYGSALVPGIHSSADAERLADELAFAVARLRVLETEPPGLYAEVAAGGGEPEERIWLAFQIAMIGPLEVSGDSAEDPFAAIAAVRTPWSAGLPPALADVPFGPRGVEATRAARTLAAYRAWAERLGGQAAGLGGEEAWAPGRRFDRAFERLGTLASLARAPRYDLLVTLGRLGVLECRGERLQLGGPDPVTLAAKRVFGIGDPLLLERRAAELADVCEVPIEALDLGLFNWERRARFGGGIDPLTPPEPSAALTARAALGL